MSSVGSTASRTGRTSTAPGSRVSAPEIWRCRRGAVCPRTQRFKEHGPCPVCLARHTRTPGSCGSQPLATTAWRELFTPRVPAYAPPAVEVNTRLIPVIFAQVRKYKIPSLFPEIDTWAVPVHKVMNAKGEFRSIDLKDYLGLPADRKLLLSTAGPDNFMEMLWERGADLDFRGHGIDYWFPAEFSIYDNDGKCFQLFNARRQQLHAQRVASQFVWFRLGANIPLSFMNPVRQASSAVISCQQMYSKRNRRILRREIALADQWFPLRTRFFFIAHPRGGLPPLRDGRVAFHLDERWLMLGINGRNRDNKPVSTLSIGELLAKNLKEAINDVAPMAAD